MWEKSFLRCYSKFKSSVLTSGGITDYFDCSIGTRQGCILSPFLFSLNMNELLEMLKCFDCKDEHVNEYAQNIMLLMYADDIAQGSCMVKDLQRMIDVLGEFCDKWGLQLNMKKTQIVVFRKNGAIRDYEKWFFKDGNIMTVPFYKYLGLLLTSNLNWRKSVYTLSVQAKKALAMVTRYSVKCGGLPVKVAFELFDKAIVPIMMYGSEIWGYMQYKALEDVHIQFCKRVLGLSNHAANKASLGECGRYPVVIFTYKRCISYWLKILEMPSSRYVKNCYLMLKNLDENGRNTWASSVRMLLYHYGFGIVWMEQGVGDKALFLKNFLTRLKDCHVQDWHRDINNSSKLSIYCTYKSMLEPEMYLDVVDIWKFRRSLTKFRVSCHNLEIEKGRHEGILLENRICKFCEAMGRVVIEDEFHFLLCCPLYEDIRMQYLEYDESNPQYESFISIMSTKSREKITKLSKFIYYAFKVREKQYKLSL